jgi:hypothetical protein
MRLAYKVRVAYMPREIPSLPRTLDSSFSLKDLSVYIIYPIYILTLYLNPYQSP